MYMEIVVVTFQYAQTHKCTAWPKNVFFLVLKLDECTATVSVCNDNYYSLILSRLNWNGRQIVIKFVNIKHHKIGQRLFAYYTRTAWGTGLFQ